MDSETPVTISTPFPYDNGPTGVGAGNVPIDAGSFQPVVAGAGPLQHRQLMSNALLVGAKRSSNGHPIFVAGPQVGYYSPEILMELDLHGGGLDARGVAFPGLGFYLQIGRGPDYAWSATSASSDVIDEFAETLCGNGTTQYSYKGQCRDMGTLRRRHAEGPERRGRHGARRTTRPCTARSSATRRPAASASRSRSTARRAGASCSARSRSRRSRPAACTRRSSSSTR